MLIQLVKYIMQHNFFLHSASQQIVDCQYQNKVYAKREKGNKSIKEHQHVFLPLVSLSFPPKKEKNVHIKFQYPHRHTQSRSSPASPSFVSPALAPFSVVSLLSKSAPLTSMSTWSTSSSDGLSAEKAGRGGRWRVWKSFKWLEALMSALDCRVFWENLVLFFLLLWRIVRNRMQSVQHVWFSLDSAWFIF